MAAAMAAAEERERRGERELTERATEAAALAVAEAEDLDAAVSAGRVAGSSCSSAYGDSPVATGSGLTVSLTAERDRALFTSVFTPP